jgi:hypothetical protein
MAPPKNFTGRMTHSVLIPPPEKSGKWRVRNSLARYEKGRLMELKGNNFPKPPEGEGFTGKFTVVACVIRELRDGGPFSDRGKASTVTFTVKDGEFVGEAERDIPLSKTEGIVF